MWREREISNLVEAKGLNEPSTGGYTLLREFFALMMRRQHTLCRCVLLFHLFQPVAVGIPFKMSVGWEGRDSLLPLSRNNMSKARCQDSRTISSRQTIGHDAAILEYCRWQWYLQPPCRKLTVLGYVLIDIRNHSPYTYKMGNFISRPSITECSRWRKKLHFFGGVLFLNCEEMRKCLLNWSTH